MRKLTLAIDREQYMVGTASTRSPTTRPAPTTPTLTSPTTGRAGRPRRAVVGAATTPARRPRAPPTAGARPTRKTRPRCARARCCLRRRGRRRARGRLRVRRRARGVTAARSSPANGAGSGPAARLRSRRVPGCARARRDAAAASRSRTARARCARGARAREREREPADGCTIRCRTSGSITTCATPAGEAADDPPREG